MNHTYRITVNNVILKYYCTYFLIIAQLHAELITTHLVSHFVGFVMGRLIWTMAWGKMFWWSFTLVLLFKLYNTIAYANSYGSGGAALMRTPVRIFAVRQCDKYPFHMDKF